ncbi:nitroreductase family protein [Nevskia soli]|uniref:nitroreductase family protein n=1 Tax=Nevskia soli TaxID=418856 RepID=UPI0015D7A379|nr:nitroreductase family protein [Nevskia soli]
MEKPAAASHPIHELLIRRWSPRAFADRPVPHDVLLRMFEAARWAASSYNEQPWTYIVGVRQVDPEQFDRLASVLAPPNAWAKRAPVLALSILKTTFSHNNSPNGVAMHDVGAASASLTIEGLRDGVFVHQMAGFNKAKAKEVFAIPDGYEPVAMLAIGYPGDPETLEEPLKGRELSERTRKPVSEFVFEGNWGERPFQP